MANDVKGNAAIQRFIDFMENKMILNMLHANIVRILKQEQMYLVDLECAASDFSPKVFQTTKKLLQNEGFILTRDDTSLTIAVPFSSSLPQSNTCKKEAELNPTQLPSELTSKQNCDKKTAGVILAKRKLENHIQTLDILIAVIEEVNELVKFKRLEETSEEENGPLYLPIEESDYGEAQIKATTLWMPLAKKAVKTSYSIRQHLLRALQLREEEFNSLFPKLAIDLTEGKTTRNDLNSLILQGQQMILYCNRILQNQSSNP